MKSVPEVSQSTPSFYLWEDLSPIIKVCFSFIHIKKLFLKLCSSMLIIKGTILIGPKEVVPLAVFTHNVFLVMSTLPAIFVNRWYNIQEHVAHVSNRAMICLQSQ